MVTTLFQILTPTLSENSIYGETFKDRPEDFFKYSLCIQFIGVDTYVRPTPVALREGSLMVPEGDQSGSVLHMSICECHETVAVGVRKFHRNFQNGIRSVGCCECMLIVLNEIVDSNIREWRRKQRNGDKYIQVYTTTTMGRSPQPTLICLLK